MKKTAHTVLAERIARDAKRLAILAVTTKAASKRTPVAYDRVVAERKRLRARVEQLKAEKRELKKDLEDTDALCELHIASLEKRRVCESKLREALAQFLEVWKDFTESADPNQALSANAERIPLIGTLLDAAKRAEPGT